MDTTSPSKSTCKVLFLLLTILPSFNLYKYYWNRSEMLVNVPGITPAMPPPPHPLWCHGRRENDNWYGPRADGAFCWQISANMLMWFSPSCNSGQMNVYRCQTQWERWVWSWWGLMSLTDVERKELSGAQTNQRTVCVARNRKHISSHWHTCGDGETTHFHAEISLEVALNTGL